MTEQEKLAREWADYAKNVAVSSPEQQAAADFILAHTAPPTMEDVEWDAREHRGLGTVGEDGTEWVMLHMMPNDWIACISSDLRKYRHLKPEWLTPNGKRYKIVEATVSQDEKVADDQPEHPKVLRTAEDYEKAPEGTVVAMVGSTPAVKTDVGDWLSAGSLVRLPNRSLGLDHEVGSVVLRWGWRGQ